MRAPEPGRPLPASMLYRSCDPSELSFELVGELEDPPGPIGQDRAVEAVEFAVAMRRKGYNVFALGPSGAGSTRPSKTCYGAGPRLRRHPPTGATSTISPTRRNRAACSCRRGAQPGFATR
jgi:hypothetical protein